jgi:hypothetical protein
MKAKILFSVMFVILFTLLYIPASYSQPFPTFNFILANDTWDSHMVYEVDIILQSTDANPIEYATGNYGLAFNNSSLNGGTVSAAWVAGSTQLTNTAQVPGILINTTNGINRLIRITGKTPPGTGNGSLITTAAGGTRIGRLRLTNTVDFTIVAPNRIDTAAQTVYPTNVNAYLAGLNTNITSARKVILNLTSLLLPVELSSFNSNVNGRQVDLNWETKTEINSRQFQIERSLSGTKDATVTWSLIGNINASGTSTTPRKYSYSDKNLQSGKYQYRIKMIDINGTFKYSSIVETEVSLPKNFDLSQNYPNPFNPSTRINYSLPFDSKVTLEVYNIAGEKMGQIVNQEQTAGFYTVNFSSSTLSRNIASGIYIYKLSATDQISGNAFTSVKKMLLLK